MQRKLTAILSADVVGYGGLVEADEAGTIARLKQNRSTIFDPQIAAHGGRVFKLMGDGALAEFSSVVEAVNCALAIQGAMAHAEPDLSEEHRIRYRIGVNLGDIIIDGDDIYGEGVNVAARLQTLAPVGGVALSRVVRDQVDGRIRCAFDDMGEHTVKNIERPVHAFSIRATEDEPMTPQKTAGTRQHAICVLPFANMSDDPQQEYFSDGISEDIITDLSKVSALNVIARNTSFQFKGKNVDVALIARQLKASHVLEGSVRKAAGRVRITAQLIDGASGNHVWAERYDRDLNDIFALQDEISEAIVKALKLKLLPEERNAIEQRGTNDLEAYNFYLMARQFWMSGNSGSARRSDAIIRLTTRAIEIDPSYARAWALMSLAQSSMDRLMVNRERKTDGGMEAAKRALVLDPGLADAHCAMSDVLLNIARNDEAGHEIAIALNLDPEGMEVVRAAAKFHFVTRNFSEAIRAYEKLASMMKDDYRSVGMLIGTYNAIGNKNGARDAARRTLERTDNVIKAEPDNGSAMSYQLSALAVLGELERAKELQKRALVLDPDNNNMRYNFACAFAAHLRDFDTALDLLEPMLQTAKVEALNWTRADADLDGLRDHPRYKAMMAAAEKRLASMGTSAAR
jgi:adenylate cyclase